MTTKQSAALGAAAVIIVGAVFLLTRHAGPPAPAPVTIRAPAVQAAQAPPADCLLPGPPPVPPAGAAATTEDMRLGHDVMQAFVVQLEAYQTCRNAQIDHAGPGVSQQQKEEWVEQGNAAIDEANALAAAFGAQLKVFKARGVQQ